MPQGVVQSGTELVGQGPSTSAIRHEELGVSDALIGSMN